jgi:hypothetical protein
MPRVGPGSCVPEGNLHKNALERAKQKENEDDRKVRHSGYILGV